MTTITKELIIQVSPQGKLDLPPEVEAQLKPFTEYRVLQSESQIILEKIDKPLTIAELKRRQELLGPDPDEPTLEEISEIVKEVRQELWSKKQ